jgi:ABC-type antimicrobial peptide transport system permease subunit
MAIPGLILALAIVAVLTPNTTNAMLAIAVVILRAGQDETFEHLW